MIAIMYYALTIIGGVAILLTGHLLDLEAWEVEAVMLAVAIVMTFGWLMFRDTSWTGNRGGQ